MVAKKPRVVIVGAGMAGLTAAHRLYASTSYRDLFDLCVVDADDRIGGRILTSEFAGDRVEVGATWIHGIGGSPIYDIADKIGVLSGDDDLPWERMDGFPEDPVTVAEGGRLVDPSLVSLISSLYKRLMDSARSGGVADDNTLSVGCFLRRGLHAYRALRDGCEQTGDDDWTLAALEDAVFAMHENTERTCTSADELVTLDLAAESEYREFPGEQITIAKGYSRVIEFLASVLPPGLIRLGKKVHLIEWCSDGSSPPSDGDGGGTTTLPVRLHFQDGTVMAVDHVIVTVSLGVLKAGVRKEGPGMVFSPSLPSFKKDAIGRLGFGVVNKLFMELDGNGEEEERFPFLQMAFDQEPESGRHVAKIPRWMRKTAFICPIYGGSRVLLAWLAGKEAMELESLDDEEIIRGIHVTLDGLSDSSEGTVYAKPDRRCNGNAEKKRSSGKIARVMRSGWGTNPLFLGSYSYVAVGSSGDDLDLMAEPLPRLSGGNMNSCGVPPLQILFAGEATHRTHYSTTHGAYFSGIREANRLLKHYSCC